MSTKTIKHMLLERLVDTSISSTLVQPDIYIFKRKDTIIWQFYSHRFVSSYDFVDFIEYFTTTFLRAHSWLNWVDEDDDDDEVGLKEKPENTRYIKKITSK